MDGEEGGRGEGAGRELGGVGEVEKGTWDGSSAGISARRQHLRVSSGRLPLGHDAVHCCGGGA